MLKNKFYVTTPIYYATAKPHLGSLYSTLIADVCARWNKFRGKKVYFLTGTDEHGQKIAQAAQKADMEPKKFVDNFIEPYKHIWKIFHIDYDQFIRTTDMHHVKAVQEWILKLLKKGDIYKSVYEGWYCIPDETYVTEKLESESQSEGPACPSCGRPTTFVSEESYFFKLSAYQNKLLDFYKKNPNFVVPKERLNEVINFVESGLKDLSISRTTVKWGITFPGNEKHTVYVWADALLNYVSAIGYADESRKKEFELLWPADLQVIGKDILRFHAVYWPAFLMASDLPLPKQLLVHGWIKVDQKKMSKSFGNIVDPEDLYKAYGADPVRYYLMSQLAITQDADFSLQSLEKHISTDLADDLGNLINRMIVLAHKNGVFELPLVTQWSKESLDLKKELNVMINEFAKEMDRYYFHVALSNLWKFIAKVNSFFHSQEPWKVANTDKVKFIEIVSATAHSIRAIGKLLLCIMPQKSIELLDSIGIERILNGDWIEKLVSEEWDKTFVLKKGPALFQKFETTKEAQVEVKEEQKQIKDEIDFEDFAKVKLVVGTIEQCEEIPKSDKLYKLQVNFGDKGIKQILAGIKPYYKPDELIGKQAVFVYNLKPRKMLGLESQGMLLASQDSEGRPRFINPISPVPNGAELR